MRMKKKYSKARIKKNNHTTPGQKPDKGKNQRKTFLRKKRNNLRKDSEAESTVTPSIANPKRKCQDKVNLESLNLVFGYFGKMFEAMQSQMDQKYLEPPWKCTIHNNYSFKR